MEGDEEASASVPPELVSVLCPRLGTAPLRTVLSGDPLANAHRPVSDGCDLRPSSGADPGLLELRATGSERRDPFRVAHHLGPDATPGSLLAAFGARACEAVVSGYNAANVFLPGSTPHGNALLWGAGAGAASGANADGYAARAVADGLLGALAAKADRLASKKRNKGGSFTFAVEVTACAYRAERFADLLSSNQPAFMEPRAGAVVTDPIDGPVVPGLSRRPASSADGARAALHRVGTAYRSLLGDSAADLGGGSGGGSGDRARLPNTSAIVTAWVSQSLVAPDGSVRAMRSSLSLVLLPDAGALALPPGRLSVTDGPLAHRGMVALANLARAFGEMAAAAKRAAAGGEAAAGDTDADRAGPALGAYGDSHLTELLREAFGGNCVTQVIALVAPEDHARSLAALRFGSLFACAPNHPVLNDSLTVAAMARLRRTIIALRDALAIARGAPEDQIADGRRRGSAVGAGLGPGGAGHDGGGVGGGGGGGGTAAELRLRIAELRDALARSERTKRDLEAERVVATDRAKTLADSLEKCARERASVQASLLASEEERLRIARALLDVEARRAALEARLPAGARGAGAEESAAWNAEERAVAAEARASVLESRLAAAEAVAEECRAESERLRRDVGAARAAAEEAAGIAAGGEGEAEELRVEMLRLVGRVRTLEADLEDAHTERADLEARLRRAGAASASASASASAAASAAAAASGPGPAGREGSAGGASYSGRGVGGDAALAREVASLRQALRRAQADAADAAERGEEHASLDRARHARELAAARDEARRLRADLDAERQVAAMARGAAEELRARQARSPSYSRAHPQDQDPGAAVEAAVAHVRAEVEARLGARLRDAETGAARLRADNAALEEQLDAARGRTRAAVREARSELRQEVRRELRDEVRDEVREELRREMPPPQHRQHQHQPAPSSSSSPSPKRPSRDDVREALRGEMRDPVRRELRDELRADARRELRDELRADVRRELRDELRADVRRELAATENEATPAAGSKQAPGAAAAANDGFREKYAAEVREKLRWQAKAREYESMNRILTEELRSRGTGGADVAPPPPVLRPTRSAGRERAPFNPNPIRGWGSPR